MPIYYIPSLTSNDGLVHDKKIPNNGLGLDQFCAITHVNQLPGVGSSFE
jgi:hypothetical protein